jgi:hypothetical protein
MEIEGNIHEMSVEEIVKTILENYFIYDGKNIPDFEYSFLLTKWEPFM